MTDKNRRMKSDYNLCTTQNKFLTYRVVILTIVLCAVILTFSNYVSASAKDPHTVISHSSGDGGADFEINMLELQTWNSTINNTGNITLTNIKMIIHGKVVQLIPKLEVGEQKDLLTLQPNEFPPGITLLIECDQGVKEEIILSRSGFTLRSHTVWEFVYLGLILSVLSLIGGIFKRKSKKSLIFFGVLFLVGIFLIFISGCYW